MGLLEQAQAGDARARDALVLSCGSAVIALARRVAPGDDLDDFVQAGISGMGPGNGLLNAIATFDLERPGARTSLSVWNSYASNGVMSALLALLPASSRRVTTRRLNASQRRIQRAAGASPQASHEELQEALAERGVRASLWEIAAALSPPRALDLSERSDEGESAEELERSLDRARMAERARALPLEQREALAKRYGLGRPEARLSATERALADSAEASLRELSSL